MKKVKLFSIANDLDKLQETIDKFLEGKVLIDARMNSQVTKMGSLWYSVTVIYKHYTDDGEQ